MSRKRLSEQLSRKTSAAVKKPKHVPRTSSHTFDMPMRVFGACHLDQKLWMGCIDGTEQRVPWQTRVDLVFLLWLKHETTDTTLAQDAADLVMREPSRASVRKWRIRSKKGQLPESHGYRVHSVSPWLVVYARDNRI